MTDPIIKIVKSGADINSQDPGDWVFHSSYTLPKIHMDQTTSMTINGGDTTKTVSFAHNLGYVPMYVGYMDDGGSITPIPKRKIIPVTGSDQHWYIWADSTNIYIKWDSVIPYLRETYYDVDTYSNLLNRYYWTVGNSSGTGLDGAFRFDPINVTKTETIISAILEPYVSAKGSSGSNTKLRCAGIDEDDTGDFGSYPMGRTQTSASVTQEQAPSSTPFYFGINVLSIFNEIRTRSGWASGNAMGFFVFNNGSPTDAYLAGYYSGNKLTIQKSGSTNYSFRVIVFKDKIA